MASAPAAPGLVGAMLARVVNQSHSVNGFSSAFPGMPLAD